MLRIRGSENYTWIENTTRTILSGAAFYPDIKVMGRDPNGSIENAEKGSEPYK
jgi:hypothetical protein